MAARKTGLIHLRTGIAALSVILVRLVAGGASLAEGISLDRLLELPSERVDPYLGALLLAGVEELDVPTATSLDYLDRLTAAVQNRTQPQNPARYLSDAVGVVFGEEGFGRIAPAAAPLGNLYFHRVLETKRGPEVAMAMLLLASVRNVAFPVKVVVDGGRFYLRSGPAGGEVFLDVGSGTIVPGKPAAGGATPEAITPSRLAVVPVLTNRELLGRYALELGQAARRERHGRSAQRLLRAAWHLSPQRPELYVELGRAALDTWHLARAERCFSRALRLDPNSTAARLGRAEIFARRGRPDAAQAALESVLAEDREDFDALVLRGEVFLARQEPRAAQDTFLPLTRRDPNAMRPWRGLALAYLARGDRTNASRCLARALELAPDAAEVHCARGRLFHDASPELALAAYKKALENNDRYAPAYEWRAALYEGRGLAEAALKDYRTYVELVPEHVRIPQIKRTIQTLRMDLGGEPDQ